MAFQFLCPQGHVLQGEESQAGQQCRCPYCQTEFVVPSPTTAPQGETPPVEPAPPAETEPEGPPEGAFPGICTGAEFGKEAAADVAAQLGVTSAEEQRLLHIPCPRGHVLETPREMLGQDAMCPFCQAQFRLRFEDSQEWQRQRDEQRDRREQKLGKAWMHWAIAVAVVVVLGVIFLVAIAVSD